MSRIIVKLLIIIMIGCSANPQDQQVGETRSANAILRIIKLWRDFVKYIPVKKVKKIPIYKKIEEFVTPHKRGFKLEPALEIKNLKKEMKQELNKSIDVIRQHNDFLDNKPIVMGITLDDFIKQSEGLESFKKILIH